MLVSELQKFLENENDKPVIFMDYGEECLDVTYSILEDKVIITISEENTLLLENFKILRILTVLMCLLCSILGLEVKFVASAALILNILIWFLI